MRNHLGHEARAAKAGKQIASGVAPEVAKQPLVAAAAAPGQDATSAGLIVDPANLASRHNVGQPLKVGPF